MGCVDHGMGWIYAWATVCWVYDATTSGGVSTMTLQELQELEQKELAIQKHYRMVIHEAQACLDAKAAFQAMNKELDELWESYATKDQPDGKDCQSPG